MEARSLLRRKSSLAENGKDSPASSSVSDGENFRRYFNRGEENSPRGRLVTRRQGRIQGRGRIGGSKILQLSGTVSEKTRITPKYSPYIIPLLQPQSSR